MRSCSLSRARPGSALTFSLARGRHSHESNRQSAVEEPLQHVDVDEGIGCILLAAGGQHYASAGGPASWQGLHAGDMAGHDGQVPKKRCVDHPPLVPAQVVHLQVRTCLEPGRAGRI